MPSSRESSQPKNWTWVSCIAGRFFTNLSHQGRHMCFTGQVVHRDPPTVLNDNVSGTLSARCSPTLGSLTFFYTSPGSVITGLSENPLCFVWLYRWKPDLSGCQRGHNNTQQNECYSRWGLHASTATRSPKIPSSELHLWTMVISHWKPLWPLKTAAWEEWDSTAHQQGLICEIT